MNIVIVGGGTAGWLMALSIIKTQGSTHNVTLIESKKIGIVGAGEGATQMLHDFVSGTWFDIGIDIKEFIEYCNVTPKMGIKHVNWTGDGSSYFAPLDGSSTSGLSPDTEFCENLIVNGDKFHLASEIGRKYEAKEPINVSYHFDAFKVGEFFAKHAIKAGVKVIDAEIYGVKTDNGEIISLLDTDNNTHEGDFFIDCSGFKRVLCGAMDIQWESYEKNLPVDSAIAFQMPLTDDYEPVTTATAMDSGWCWKIPTTERFGCGYVYSSKFITDAKAEEELRAKFGDVEILRKLKFTSGRSEVLWKNNCLALGLSAAFAEPLEATSIHTTIIQAMSFVMEHLQETKKETCNQYRINHYNKEMIKLYDDIRDFLVVHYTGGRDDTEFWRHVNSGDTWTKTVKYMLSISKTSVPSALTLEHYFGCSGVMLWNWILAGLGHIDKNKASNSLKRFKG